MRLIESFLHLVLASALLHSTATSCDDKENSTRHAKVSDLLVSSILSKVNSKSADTGSTPSPKSNDNKETTHSVGGSNSSVRRHRRTLSSYISQDADDLERVLPIGPITSSLFGMAQTYKPPRAGIAGASGASSSSLGTSASATSAGTSPSFGGYGAASPASSSGASAAAATTTTTTTEKSAASSSATSPAASLGGSAGSGAAAASSAEKITTTTSTSSANAASSALGAAPSGSSAGAASAATTTSKTTSTSNAAASAGSSGQQNGFFGADQQYQGGLGFGLSRPAASSSSASAGGASTTSTTTESTTTSNAASSAAGGQQVDSSGYNQQYGSFQQGGLYGLDQRYLGAGLGGAASSGSASVSSGGSSLTSTTSSSNGASSAVAGPQAGYSQQYELGDAEGASAASFGGIQQGGFYGLDQQYLGAGLGGAASSGSAAASSGGSSVTTSTTSTSNAAGASSTAGGQQGDSYGLGSQYPYGGMGGSSAASFGGMQRQGGLYWLDPQYPSVGLGGMAASGSAAASGAGSSVTTSTTSTSNTAGASSAAGGQQAGFGQQYGYGGAAGASSASFGGLQQQGGLYGLDQRYLDSGLGGAAASSSAAASGGSSVTTSTTSTTNTAGASSAAGAQQSGLGQQYGFGQYGLDGQYLGLGGASSGSAAATSGGSSATTSTTSTSNAAGTSSAAAGPQPGFGQYGFYGAGGASAASFGDLRQQNGLDGQYLGLGGSPAGSAAASSSSGGSSVTTSTTSNSNAASASSAAGSQQAEPFGFGQQYELSGAGGASAASFGGIQQQGGLYGLDQQYLGTGIGGPAASGSTATSGGSSVTTSTTSTSNAAGASSAAGGMQAGLGGFGQQYSGEAGVASTGSAATTTTTVTKQSSSAAASGGQQSGGSAAPATSAGGLNLADSSFQSGQPIYYTQQSIDPQLDMDHSISSQQSLMSSNYPLINQQQFLGAAPSSSAAASSVGSSQLLGNQAGTFAGSALSPYSNSLAEVGGYVGGSRAYGSGLGSQSVAASTGGSGIYSSVGASGGTLLGAQDPLSLGQSSLIHPDALEYDANWLGGSSVGGAQNGAASSASSTSVSQTTSAASSGTGSASGAGSASAASTTTTTSSAAAAARSGSSSSQPTVGGANSGAASGASSATTTTTTTTAAGSSSASSADANVSGSMGLTSSLGGPQIADASASSSAGAGASASQTTTTSTTTTANAAGSAGQNQYQGNDQFLLGDGLYSQQAGGLYPTSTASSAGGSSSAISSTTTSSTSSSAASAAGGLGTSAAASSASNVNNVAGSSGLAGQFGQHAWLNNQQPLGFAASAGAALSSAPSSIYDQQRAAVHDDEDPDHIDSVTSTAQAQGLATAILPNYQYNSAPIYQQYLPQQLEQIKQQRSLNQLRGQELFQQQQTSQPYQAANLIFNGVQGQGLVYGSEFLQNSAQLQLGPQSLVPFSTFPPPINVKLHPTEPIDNAASWIAGGDDANSRRLSMNMMPLAVTPMDTENYQLIGAEAGFEADENPQLIMQKGFGEPGLEGLAFEETPLEPKAVQAMPVGPLNSWRRANNREFYSELANGAYDQMKPLLDPTAPVGIVMPWWALQPVQVDSQIILAPTFAGFDSTGASFSPSGAPSPLLLGGFEVWNELNPLEEMRADVARGVRDVNRPIVVDSMSYQTDAYVDGSSTPANPRLIRWDSGPLIERKVFYPLEIGAR